MQKKSFLGSVNSAIDSCIGVFSPKKELERRLYRQANYLALRGSYEGSRHDRNRKPWIPLGGSADEDLLEDLALLRQRSRDLIRNDGIAAGIVETMVSNVVGHGHYPQSVIDGTKVSLSDEAVEVLRSKIEEGWDVWSPWADTANRMSFWEMQQVICRQIFTNGDVFVLREMISDEAWRPYSLALNIVEADRVDTPSDKKSAKNIRKGVELGTRGQPVAYWVCKSHPGDFTYNRRTPDAKEYIRVPLMSEYGQRNVQHLYGIKRPGQTRGEPMLSAVLNKFRDLGEYMEAELIAAKLAACFGIIIKQNGSPYQSAIGAGEEQSDGRRVEKIYPGMVERIGVGEDITQINPVRPGSQFDPFVDKNLRFIGSGVNMPYELIFKDFSKSNFSSSRAAILEARKYFRCLQIYLTEKFCQPVYDNFVEEMFLRGQIDAPNFYELKNQYNAVSWLSPGWAYIEPEKEIDAAITAIDNNVSTLADESSARGRDWEEVLKQRSRELKKMKDLGIQQGPGTIKKFSIGDQPQNNQGGKDETDQ